MEDRKKTKEQLISELAKTRRRLAEMEEREAESRRAENELRRANSELGAIFRALPDLYFRFKADGTILDYKAGCPADLYALPEVFLGRRMQDVLPPEAARRHEEGIREALAANAPATVEYSLAMPQGEQFFEARMVPLGDDQLIEVVRNVTGRKRAEEELRAANESLRIYARLVEASPDLISVVGRDWMYRMVNPNYTRFHGLPEERIVGHHVAEIHVAEEYENLIRPHLERCFAGESVHYEGCFTYGAAGRRYMDVHYYPLCADGQVEYAVVLVRDITARKRMEDALRESEERFRLLAETSSEVIYRVRLKPELAFEYVSPASTRITGYAPEEHYANPRLAFEAVHPEDRPAFEAIMSCLHPPGAPAVHRWVRKDGKLIWVEHRCTPIRDERGECVAIVGIAHDVTDRVQAERALRESEERFRSLVETTSDWVWEVDERAVYSYVSPRVRDLLGYEPEEVLGKTPFDLMPPEEARRLAPVFLALVGKRQPIERLENVNRHKDGHLVVLETSGVPFFDAEGNIRGYRGIDRDITERKEAERLREEYLSLISHDLRAPLTVMMGQASWLQRALAKKQLEREAASAEAILKGAKRMNSMIQDLVESSRLEAGRMEMRKRPTDLLELVSDLAGRVGTLEDRARLRVESMGPLPPVSLDPDRIERALVNLITNALKFSPPDRPVVIRVERRADEAVVSVIDQGVGIAPEELPHIFERFYRARAGRRAEGLGLGLYITRLIVEAHGGRIWVESKPGKGSTFSFALPISSQSHQP